MKRTHCGLLTISGICLLSAGLAQAQVVLVGLDSQPAGGARAMIPQKVTLSDQRPDNLTKEPAYLNKPQYGVIRLGDAKENRIVISVDVESKSAKPRIYVDGNGNGDLTDDPAVKLMQLPVTTASAAGQGGSANRWGASVAVVARYNVAGRGGVLPGTIQVAYWDGDLTVNREYARVGILKLPTRSFRIALVDQNSTARFDDFMHEQEEPAKVTVLVDRNNDGLFDLKREVFDAAMPFRVGGATYRVTAIDPRGMQMTLRRTEKKLRSAISPASLKVGATIIDFDVETLDNKSVAFPDDYKGKIVLLDFWAMWCPPCLEEIPNIVRVYEQYKKEGFDILGVSLDKENQNKKLEEFLKENEMPWKQVYDGGFWKAEVAELFKINSIPMAYLVDGDTGKILAMGDALRGEGLAAEVEKALDRKKGRRN